MAATITGDKALDRKLARLASRDSKRARTAAARAGVTAIARGIRSEVPVGETKQLKKSIGGRIAKAKGGPAKGITEAKAGVNVGKKRDKRAPHAHLAGMGTGERWTGEAKRKRKKGGVSVKKTGNPRAYRGVMPANDFVERGFNKSAASAKSMMLEKLGKEIDKAAQRK